MTRAEHLAYAKARAINAFDFQSSPSDAMASLVSDFYDHDELRPMVVVAGMLGLAMLAKTPVTRRDVLRYVEGFN